MKTKPIAVLFVIIVFAFAALNIPNAANAIKTSIDGKSAPEKAIKKIEKTYSDDFVGKYKFVEINGITNKSIGQKNINGSILMDNGYLTMKNGFCNMKKQAASIVKVGKYLKKMQADFVYVAAPFKNSPYENLLPYGIMDYSNVNQDNLIDKLNEEDTATYDLREELQRSDFDWCEAFYKTDHHWKPETGHWAYTKMAEYLSDHFGYERNKKSENINNYSIDVHEGIFLGSEGKKTGKYVAGLDDISVIYPNWGTDIEVIYNETGVKRAGNYKDAIFDKSILREDLYGVNQYTTYIGNSIGQCTIKNKEACNSAKLLIVRDSFSLVSAPYFTFMFDRVDLLDLRYYDEMTLVEYIDKIKPDVVIMSYCASTLNDKSAFRFGL